MFPWKANLGRRSLECFANHCLRPLAPPEFVWSLDRQHDSHPHIFPGTDESRASALHGGSSGSPPWWDMQHPARLDPFYRAASRAEHQPLTEGNERLLEQERAAASRVTRMTPNVLWDRFLPRFLSSSQHFPESQYSPWRLMEEAHCSFCLAKVGMSDSLCAQANTGAMPRPHPPHPWQHGYIFL